MYYQGSTNERIKIQKVHYFLLNLETQVVAGCIAMRKCLCHVAMYFNLQFKYTDM